MNRRENMEKIAERIKTLRIEAGVSTRQVGEVIGVSHSTVNRWENCKRIPDALNIKALAKFFNVSADYLLGLDMIN